MESSPSVSIHAPTITKNENSESSGMEQSNVEKRPAWNKPSNGDSVSWPGVGAFSWPALSEMKKAPSNKSSSDPLTSMSDESSSSSVSVYQEELLSTPINASVFANGTVAQPSRQSSSPYPFPRGQNQRNEIASPSHGDTQNQYQWKSYKNPNGNYHHHHQSHGGMRNFEHGNQNFNGRGRFAQTQRSIQEFVRYASLPPPPLSPIFAPYILPTHQPFYPFCSPMAFHDLAPPLMYYHSPPRVPFIKPHEVFNQVQKASLETRIRNQVHYYFSEENLKTDEFKRMNGEGFVHIQFIAGFNKLKALTCNIQLILDALQGSYHVELKGYEIRSRHMWRKYLMPLHLRVPFDPSL